MLKFFHVHLILLFFIVSLLNAQSVLINELLPRNGNNFADEDGDWSDWIEIFNPTSTSVDLTGYGITDNSKDPFKWIFPSKILQAGEHMILFASDKDRRNLLYWQTVIQQGELWRYRKGTSEPPANWTEIEFNDFVWQEGPSGFGYGDNDDATLVENSLSIYMRKKFTIDDIETITRVVLHVDFDDAFVAYLNGHEIQRANIGEAGQPTPYNKPADNGHEALIYQGLTPEVFEIPLPDAYLHNGLNVLALQVHNSNISSSDMTLIPFLSLGRSTNTSLQSSVPPILNLKPNYLHSNFKLKAGGETVALFSTDGTVVDSVRFPQVPMNISFGRTAEASADWNLLAVPTPGAANDSTVYVGQAPSPLFSVSGGLYKGSLTLELADTSGGAIYYTLDGSEPDNRSTPYTTPLHLRKTTAVRARSYRPPLYASRVISHTYVINEDSPFAIICLSTDPDSLFDEEYGLFEMGPDASQDYPYFGANFWKDWERPVHVEFYEPDGRRAFELDAGMKVFGGWSRGRLQKSLAIFQRAQYDTAQINYQIFPDKEIHHFESFILRNGGNDWEGTYWRDEFMQELCGDGMDLDVMAFRPAHIYLNGGYWGILNVREKLNESFVQANRGVDPEFVDILDGAGTDDWMVLAGSKDEYISLLKFIQSHDLSTLQNYAVVDSLIDINNFIDYQIAQIFIGNTDWPGANIKYYRPQRPGGKWRWLIYDTDFGFYLYDTSFMHNTLAFALEPNGPTWPNPPWSTLMLRSLLENDFFKRLFINRFADHMNTTFVPQRSHDLLDKFEALFETERDRQKNRWPGSLAGYNSCLYRMRTFADRRISYVRGHIRSQFNIAGLIDVQLNVKPGGHGKIRVNSKVISDFPWTGKYFQDIPITLTAIPDIGYRFISWTSSELSDISTVHYPSRQDLNVTAVFEPTTESSQIVINEINYNSSREFPSKDWVELYNPNDVTLSLAGWSLYDQTAGLSFVLPDHAVLPALGYAVLCADTSLVKAVYPRIDNFYGNLGFNLSNTGESLALYDAAGQVVDSLIFDDAQPWPVEADGEGYTLELIDPSQDNALPQNWTASSVFGGTPGSSNSRAMRVDKMINVQPSRFELLRNFPNPFNSETCIRYTLPGAGMATLTIYDITGRQVITLVNECQTLGMHEVFWKANVASGIYFYRLVFLNDRGQETFVRKMLLLR